MMKLRLDTPDREYIKHKGVDLKDHSAECQRS